MRRLVSKCRYVKITTDSIRKVSVKKFIKLLGGELYTQNSNFYLKTKFYHW